jgi:hypothetical protein
LTLAAFFLTVTLSLAENACLPVLVRIVACTLPPGLATRFSLLILIAILRPVLVLIGRPPILVLTNGLDLWFLVL